MVAQRRRGGSECVASDRDSSFSTYPVRTKPKGEAEGKVENDYEEKEKSYYAKVPAGGQKGAE